MLFQNLITINTLLPIKFFKLNKKIMKNCITMFSLLLLYGCSNTSSVKIGYEQDEGSIIDINSADVESTDVIKKYFDAYNIRDYETIKDLEHDDVTYYGPSGELVVGIDEHYKLSKEFLTAYPNTKWTINWSVSTDVMFTEKPIENWVTTGLSITFGDDSMNDISRVVDAKIIDGKLKTVYVYQRQLTESELE
jgi:hypothetical protein